MCHRQLSLWDNEALEAGYRLLSNLELKEAEVHFNEALDGAFGDTDETVKAIFACQKWHTLLDPESESREDGQLRTSIDILLNTYRDFQFISPLKDFKKALLCHIVSRLQEMNLMDLNSVETAFDLLLEIKDFNKGKSLMEKVISQYPALSELNYMLAQAQYRNGEKRVANKTYARLLLYYPENVVRERIENRILRTLIDSHGAAMAPVYGLLRQAVPRILPLEEIEISSSEHENAVECYKLIFAANKSMKEGDTKEMTRYRKKLNMRSPELFGEYMKWVKAGVWYFIR